MRTFRMAACTAAIIGSVALWMAASAGAQCVGDCGDDGAVTINDLILGVNIALGNRPASACPAFQNASGMVDVAQLVRAVNFALRGCPPADTPTATAVGPTDTPTAGATATATPSPSATLGPTGAQRCTLLSGGSASHLEVNLAGFSAPIVASLRGSVDVACGATGSDGRAVCACRAGTFEPIAITGLGKVCIAPSDVACPLRPAACAGGGTPLGVMVSGDGNIGTCAGNAECATLCSNMCAGGRFDSGCTGFCSAGAMGTCGRNSDCAPNDGVCNGPDPVRTPGRCQCQCLDDGAGAAPRPGELQCSLSWTFAVVDPAADCTAPPLFTAPGCVPITTSTASAVMVDVNNGGSIPASGVLSNDGVPLSCDALRQGPLTGLKLRGTFGAFGATVAGDALNELFLDCQ